MMRFVTLLIALTLGACATSTNEPSQYLLRSDAELASRQLATSDEYALGDIFIAPYIDQQGLVLETSPGEMRAANHHRWAEPINSGIRSFLRQEISAVINQDLPIYTQRGSGAQINVRIDQLHGTHDGEARLVAYWWLSSDGDSRNGVQFAENQALEEDGYTALVKAEKILLSKLAQDIGAALSNAKSAGE